jgi:hypothetical protein
MKESFKGRNNGEQIIFSPGLNSLRRQGMGGTGRGRCMGMGSPGVPGVSGNQQYCIGIKRVMFISCQYFMSAKYTCQQLNPQLP